MRPHSITDFDPYLTLWKQALRRGIVAPSAQPLNEEESWARLLRMIGHWTTFSFGPFVVIDRASSSIIGEVGFANMHRGQGPSFDDVPEAMWKVDHSNQGRGIAKEAMQATIAWFDSRNISPRTVCMIDQHNIASRRVAESLEFREFAYAIYREHSVIMFQRNVTREVTAAKS